MKDKARETVKALWMDKAITDLINASVITNWTVKIKE